jgi:hypothetical protein
LQSQTERASQFATAFFVFTNRDKSRLRVLYLDKTDFALWIKRLEKDRFPWPKNFTSREVQIRSHELNWLLNGFNIWITNLTRNFIVPQQHSDTSAFVRYETQTTNNANKEDLTKTISQLKPKTGLSMRQ